MITLEIKTFQRFCDNEYKQQDRNLCVPTKCCYPRGVTLNRIMG